MNKTITHLDELETETKFVATVVSSERITSEDSDDEVRELLLDVDRPDFPYKVGQSIGVFAPGDPAFGKEHHFRLYSVADLPERSETGAPRIWTRQDGTAGASFEVHANTVKFLGRRGEGVAMEPGVTLEEPPPGVEEGEEELPF